MRRLRRINPRREIRQAQKSISTNPVGALRRTIRAAAAAGLLPEDWQTREGDPICTARWQHEVFQYMGMALLFEKDGDTAGYRKWLGNAHEAAEIYLERVHTLEPEQRAKLLDEAEKMLASIRRKLDEGT